MSFDQAQVFVLLAALGVPFMATVATLLIPSTQKMTVRYISLFASGILLALSIYIFVAYQTGTSVIQMELSWAWIENVGFLKTNVIALHLGVDGISALMVLLTGVVAFAGTLVSWKLDYRAKDFFVLYWVLLSGVLGPFLALALFFFFFFY